MNCPVCVSERLVMSEKQGIEIDYCPKCRGVWLDRGELDKIVEKSIASQNQSSTQNQYYDPTQQAPGYYGAPQYGYEAHHGRQDEHSYPYNQRKKESFWGELFG